MGKSSLEDLESFIKERKEYLTGAIELQLKASGSFELTVNKEDVPSVDQAVKTLRSISRSIGRSLGWKMQTWQSEKFSDGSIHFAVFVKDADERYKALWRRRAQLRDRELSDRMSELALLRPNLEVTLK